MERSDCLENYFWECLGAVEKINARGLTDTIRLGEHHARLVTFSQEMRQVLYPALSHLETAQSSEVDLKIFYLSDEHLESAFPALDWTHMEFDAQGFSKMINQEKVSIFFQPWLRQLFIYSHEERIGIYWTKTIAEIPWWESTFSFRTIFHFWSQQTNYQLMHAGAIALDRQRAVLMPAPSGSGKSTTTCYLQEAGYGYLGDDYVLVDTLKNKVYKLYGCAKMEWDNLLERFPHLVQSCVNVALQPQQKGIFYPDEPADLGHGHSIQAIVVPKLAQREPGFEPTSAGKSLLSIAPTTLHHLPHHRSVSYQKIQSLVSGTPNFTWQLPHQPDYLLNQFKQFANENLTERSHPELQPEALAS